MIRYALSCTDGHGFDAWFRSSGDFDAQAARGLLSCPSCGSPEIAKGLMAPALAKAEPFGRSGDETPAEPAASTADVALTTEPEAKLRAMLREVHAHVKANSENVGEAFPDLARKMHAEEIEKRSIYGRATPGEARALADEGVEIHPLPRFPDEGN